MYHLNKGSVSCVLSLISTNSSTSLNPSAYHLPTDHKKQMEKGNDLPQKMKGKELHAHVRALLAQMEEDDKEEFFADAKKQGF